MTTTSGRDSRPRRALAVLLAATVVGAVLSGALAAAPMARAAAGDTWVAELALADGDDTNVVAGGGTVRLGDRPVRAQSARSARIEGELLLPVRHGAAPVDRITARPAADVPPGAQVLVDVRGLRADGTWSQWTSTATGPAVLPEPTRDTQVRVTLVAGEGGASPALRRLWLAADRGGSPAAKAGPAVSSRVFATRIGLVGNTTANGHVIVPRDHFVALPSRRGLSPRGTGDYTVKVCAPNGRCAWAPVWDVGPWNIRDDYWNPTAVRQEWRDLPQGLPQAQAAFQRGHHGGTDGFGRRVANPAGIDLADGTFADDLQLRDNSWVTVTYLWTGAGPTALARPTTSPTLVVRSAPSHSSSAVGAVAAGARVAVTCTAAGVVHHPGSQGPWLQIGPQQYVPAAAVEAPRVAPC